MVPSANAMLASMTPVTFANMHFLPRYRSGVVSHTLPSERDSLSARGSDEQGWAVGVTAVAGGSGQAI